MPSQKAREVELQTCEGKVAKLKGQLPQVKTNKEYTAFQHEIDALNADNSLLEEEVLRRFDTIEETQREVQAQRTQLAEQQERVRAERTRIEREIVEIGEGITRLEQTRRELAPQVSSETLAVYERVLAGRHGLALVALVNESCGGCDRRVTPQIISEVHLGANLTTCESCNRILYTDEAVS